MEILGLKDADLLNQLYDGVYVHDLEGKITFWNAAAERLTGYSRSDVLGKSCSEGILMHVDENGELLCTANCPMLASRNDGLYREANIFLHHKDGHRVPVLVKAGPIRDTQGEIVGSIEIFSDNSQQMASRERIAQLEKLALLDELTQLPNRRFADAILHSKFGEFERAGLVFGAIMADIDHFKDVNDRWGHSAGDEVLRVVAKTMDSVRRPYDMVARWGGEEFLCVVAASDREALRSVAERLRIQVASSTAMVNGESLMVTISLGGALCSEGDDAESLVRKADEMLYVSKNSGRNRETIF